MKGYDLLLAARMRQELRVPITLLGGAGSHQDIEALVGECGLVGASAGSIFVFKGPYRAVLINYPNPEQKDAICSSGLATFSKK
jgi:cyclase